MGALPSPGRLPGAGFAVCNYHQFVRSLDMRSGCPGAARAERPVDATTGYGLWVNLATVGSASRAADPRPASRRNHTPVLVLRAGCDYLRWEVTREYRDTFPRATLLTVDGAGHTVLADKPAGTGTAAVAFLTGGALPAEPYTAAEPPWRR